MKKLLIVLLALLWAEPAQAQPVGPPALYCNQTFQVSQGATALTRIVQGQAGKTISVCGWGANSGAAAGTFQLQYGTGTNCGTNTTALTPVYSLAINGVLVDHIPNVSVSLPQQIGGAQTDLCLVTTGTGPVQLVLYYGVF